MKRLNKLLILPVLTTLLAIGSSYQGMRMEERLSDLNNKAKESEEIHYDNLRKIHKKYPVSPYTPKIDLEGFLRDMDAPYVRESHKTFLENIQRVEDAKNDAGNWWSAGFFFGLVGIFSCLRGMYYPLKKIE